MNVLHFQVFQSSIEPMGATLIDNLSEKDLSKVKSLALIELTALFDSHNISYSHSKRTKNIKGMETSTLLS